MKHSGGVEHQNVVSTEGTARGLATGLENQGVGLVAGQGFDTSTFLMAKVIQVKCGQCNGSGVRTYNRSRGPETCRYCGGTGKVTTVEQT